MGEKPLIGGEECLLFLYISSLLWGRCLLSFFGTHHSTSASLIPVNRQINSIRSRGVILSQPLVRCGEVRTLGVILATHTNAVRLTGVHSTLQQRMLELGARAFALARARVD